MSVTHVNASLHVGRPSGAQRPGGLQSPAFERLSVGQIVNVHVLRRFDVHRYLVSIDGHAHHVESASTLTVGSRGHATVAALGEKLELRIEELQPGSPPAEQSETDAADGGLQAPAEPARQVVTELENRYRIALDAAERGELAAAVAASTHPETMARGGLFLSRLGAPFTSSNVEALYAAQVGRRAGAPPPVESLSDLTALAAALIAGDAAALESMQQVLMDALNGPDSVAAGIEGDAGAAATQGESGAELSSGGTGSDAGWHGADSDRRDERQPQDARENLARWLLNLQDGGALAHRYGSLPVLVGGQLVELDLVLFHQRPRDGAPREPLRRLVMTLRTETFGALQVMAEAHDNRLVISFTGRSATDTDALAEHGTEVRRLVERLGWSVESVGYSFDPLQARAASQVVRHVLDAGSVDRLL